MRKTLIKEGRRPKISIYTLIRRGYIVLIR